MKLLRLKSLFIGFLFIFIGVLSAEEYDYFSLSYQGKYIQAKLGFRENYLRMEDNPDEYDVKSSNLANFLKDATIFRDFEAIKWLSLLVDERRKILALRETDSAAFYDLKLAILKDIALLHNPSLTVASRLDVVKSHENIVYFNALSDGEFIFVCNQIIDFFISIQNIKTAKKRAYTCLGQVAVLNNFSVDEALGFLARLHRVRLLTNTRSGDNRIDLAINTITNSQKINYFAPAALDALSSLALSESFRGSYFVQPIHRTIGVIKNQGAFISPNILLGTQYAYDIVNQQYGLAEQQSLDSDYPPELISMFYKLGELKLFNSGQTLNQRIQTDHKTSDTALDLLYRLIHLAPEKKNLDLITDLVSKFRSLSLSQYSFSHSYLSFENLESSFEYFALQTIMTYFSSSDNLINKEISKDLFAILFRPRSSADYFSIVANNPSLARSEMHEIAQVPLKLAKDINQVSVSLVERIVEKSIDFHSRNHSFKPQDDFRTSGSAAYDFLADHRYLEKFIRQFDVASGNNFSQSLLKTEVTLDELQTTLKRDQILIAYKRFPYERFKNFIFKCKITKDSFKCIVEKTSAGFRDSLVSFRKQIVEEKGKTFDQELSAKIYKIIFPEVDLSDYEEILIYPDPRDTSLPFSALMTAESQFLGKSHNFSLLTSLLASREIRSNKTFLGSYLALGDPSYQRVIAADLSQEPIFTLRSSEQIKELTGLSLLPETRSEILTVSQIVPEKKQKILLGAEANEINFRLASPGQYKFIHFATHGITEGDFETIREPALALSPNSFPQTTLVDSLLTETEITELDLHGTNVILSACETAGNFGGGAYSGFSGLANAFLRAGSNSVIATQWKIESSSAAILISDAVKSSLEKSEKTDVSLRDSVNKFFDENSSNPYYWAAFVKFKSLKLPNLDLAPEFSKKHVINFEFADDGYFEPYKLVKFKNKIYLNGVFIEYSNKRTRARSGLINILDDSKFWLPKNFSTYSFLTSDSQYLKMIGTVHDGLSVNPAVLRVDPEQRKAEVLTSISVKRVLNKKNDQFIADMGIVHASFEHQDGALSLIIQSMMNPENDQFEAYHMGENGITADYWYLKLNSEYDIIKKSKLPYERVGAKFFFYNGTLYGHHTDIFERGSEYKFLNEWGTSGCNGPSTFLYEYDFGENSFTLVNKFLDVMGIEYIGDSKLFVKKHCDYPTYTSIYSLTDRSLSLPLAVTMGSLSGEVLKLNPGFNLYFGQAKLPVSFLKMQEMKRDENLNPVFNRAINMQKKDFIIDPEAQWLKYLVVENAEGVLANGDIQFSRLPSFYIDGLVDQDWLYLLETSERQNVSVSRININAITERLENVAFE